MTNLLRRDEWISFVFLLAFISPNVSDKKRKHSKKDTGVGAKTKKNQVANFNIQRPEITKEKVLALKADKALI